MLTAVENGEWHYVHPDSASNDYMLRVSEDVLEIVDEGTESVLATVPIAGLDRVLIEGSSQDDNLIVDFTTGNPIPGGGLVYDGRGQVTGDALELRHRDTSAVPLDSIDYTFWNETDGQIQLAGLGEVTFIGLEPIVDNLDAIDRTFEFADGDDAIRIFDDATPDNDMTVIDSNMAEAVTFSTPTNSLTVDAGDGTNTIVIESVDARFEVPTFSVFGGSMADEFQMQVGLANTTTNVSLRGGADQAFIMATGPGSETNVDLGEGDDHFSVANPEGLASSLDGILGPVRVQGGVDSDATFTDAVSASVTVKEKSITNEVEAELTSGDVFEVVDSLATDPQIYFITVDSVQRVTSGGATISYEGFEDLRLATGQGDDSVTVLTNSTGQTVDVMTGAGDDLIRVLGTGESSLLQLDLGVGADELNVTSSGSSSIIRAETGDGVDRVTIASTGSRSALVARTGGSADEITVQSTGEASVTQFFTENQPDAVSLMGSGDDSVIEVDSGSGADQIIVADSGRGGGVGIQAAHGMDSITIAKTGTEALVNVDSSTSADTINIQSTAPGSSTEVSSGALSDIINLSSDAPFNLGTVDEIQGTLCINGGDHTSETRSESVSSSFAVKRSSDRRDFSATAQLEVVIGDILNFADNQNAGESYELTDKSIGRMLAESPIAYEMIETLNVVSGDGDDNWGIFTTVAETSVFLATGGGDDVVGVGGSGTSSLLDIDFGEGNNVTNVAMSGQGSIVKLAAGAGEDDFMVTGAGESSGIVAMTGDGEDALRFDDTGQGVAILAETGQGNDTLNMFGVGDRSSATLKAGEGDDELRIRRSAADAGVLLNGQAGNDTIFVEGTSDDSGLRVVAAAGADRIEVWSTGQGSVSDVLGGSGTDTIEVFDGSGEEGAFFPIRGELCLFGQTEDEDIELESSVSAELDIKDGQFDRELMVALPVFLGDTLTVRDVAELEGAQYRLNASSFSVAFGEQSAAIQYDDFEIVTLESGVGGDIWDVEMTAMGARTSIDTGGGADVVSLVDTAPGSELGLTLGEGSNALALLDTGEGSIARLHSGSEDDVFAVLLTGERSAVTIDAGLGDDVVTTQATGDRSILRVRARDGADQLDLRSAGTESLTEFMGSDGADVVVIDDHGEGAGAAINLGDGDDTASIIGTGAASGITVTAGDGADEIIVRATGPESITDIRGGGDADLFMVSDAGKLSAIEGDVCVAGDDHGSEMDSHTLGIDLNVRMGEDDEYSRSNEVTVNSQVGDQLRVLDDANDAGGAFVLGASMLSREDVEGPAGTILFETIEELNLSTGPGVDKLNIIGSIGRTHIFTGLGADVLNVSDPTSDSHLSIDTDQGADRIDIELTGAGGLLELDAGTGPDVIRATGFGIGSAAAIDADFGTDEVVVDSTPDAGLLQVVGGGGDDQIMLLSTAAESLASIQGGTGDDIISVNVDGADSGAAVDGGDGMDQIMIEGLASTAGLRALGGGSADTVTAASSVLAASSELYGDTDSQIQKERGNVLELTDEAATLDLGDLSAQFVFDFSALSLVSNVPTVVSVDAAAVDAFGSPLMLVGGREDTLELAEGWEFEKTGFEGSDFFNEVVDGPITLQLVGFNPWQQPVNRFDINNDGAIGPVDALLLIGQLGILDLLAFPPVPGNAPDLEMLFHYDVNGDGALGPVDPLLVIGELPSTSGAAATAALSSSAPGPAIVDAFFASLDEDEYDQRA